MENKNQNTILPGEDPQPAFDDYILQLPKSKQTAHQWLGWAAIAAIILVFGMFIFALYTSINWKSAGEAEVVLTWIYFFLIGGIGAFLLGVDTLIVGATIPLPFDGSKNSYKTGSRAVKEGRGMILYGAVVIILSIIGMTGVRSGIIGINEWVKFIVSVFVIIGIVSGLIAIVRKSLRSRSG